MKLSVAQLYRQCAETLQEVDAVALAENNKEHELKTAGIIAVAAISLLCMYYLFRSPRTGYFILENLLSVATSTETSKALLKDHFRLTYLLWWVFGSFVFYLLLPGLYVRAVLKQPLREFGFTTAQYKSHLPLYALLFTPVALSVIAVSFLPSFQAYYPLYSSAPSLLLFLLWEPFYVLQFVALEFFYRGFLLHGLKLRYGSAALWIMVLPYFMIHFGKPWPEAAGAFVAGTVLGLLSLRTGSILGGITVHVAVALLMDLLACWQRGWFSL
jgi:membrane protease YdiL (CAAX protease family)